MAGPNFARKEQERRAKNVRYRPFDLSVPSLGQIVWQDGQPRFDIDPVNAEQQRILSNLVGSGVAAADRLRPGVVDYARRGLDTSAGLFEQLARTDPLSQAEARFDRLRTVLAPERAQEREDLTAQLLRQGRLDSTGGNYLEGDLVARQQAYDARLLNQLVGEEEQYQRNLLQDALTAGQVGGTTYGAFATPLANMLQQQQSMQLLPAQQLSQLLGLSQNLSATELEGRLAEAGAIAQYNQSMAAAPSSGGMLSGILSGVAGGIGTGLAGPVGGAIGSWAGNLFSGAAGGAAGGNAAGYTGNLFGAPAGF